MREKKHRLRKRVCQCLLAALLITAQTAASVKLWAAGQGNMTVLAASKEIADLTNRAETFSDICLSTDYNTWTYSAHVSPVSQFVTNDGKYAAAYAGEKQIRIYIYNTDLTLDRIITMDRKYELVGSVACDQKGLFYVVYGIENQTEDTSKIVLSVAKYDTDGTFVVEVTYAGNETCPYDGDGWGTKDPFRSGNCSVDFNGTVLVCNYSRTMYNGHQSNHVIYVNTDTMQKVNIAPSYVSHSFDQRVIVTSDGSYLTVNHGDASRRAFVVSKILPGTTDPFQVANFDAFHFREGMNRDFGYNETYAQMGGIVELMESYVLAASSEKTLSLETAPTSRYYCGHSEARNLFVQFLKKDFENYSGSAKYQVAGETRTAVGTKPAEALTKLFLTEGVTDYGVIWLTDYEDEYFASNPKVLTISQDQLAVFWEKRKYGKDDEGTLVDSYYMILSNDGSILRKPVSLGKAELTTDEEFVFLNDSVYWTVTHQQSYGEEMKLITYRVNLKNIMETVSVEKLRFEYDKKNAEVPEVKAYDGERKLTEGVDYSIKKQKSKTKHVYELKVTGKGRYSGSKILQYIRIPEQTMIDEIESDSKNAVYLCLDGGYGCDGYLVQYSTSKDMSKAKKITLTSSMIYLDGLKSKTTYYFKARAYVTVDGKRCYGEFSSVGKVKVK